MGRKLSFAENIFSIIKDDLYTKQICVLGMKFYYTKKSRVDLKYYHNLPLQNNKIVFRSVHSAYNCNPKYIAEEIIRRGLNYELVWIADKYILKYIDSFPKNIRLVMNSTEEALKEYATAKIWIDNEFRTFAVKKGLYKREGQVYINTWHGSLGIKKCSFARSDAKKLNMRMAMIDKEQVDILISNSKFETDFYKSVGYNNSRIMEMGHPRNDIFFKENTDIKRKIRKIFNISDNKSIVMYAPTFRQSSDFDCYKVDFSALKTALKQKFNGDWVIINRLHPKLQEFKDKFECDGINILDAADYPDMQELLAASDILITDYSSCIYDFMLQYKPGFIFATDIKDYENSRGLYYPLVSTPFPVAENNDELIKNIENFDLKKYKVKVKEFLDKKGCIDDGHAAERTVDLIEKLMKETQIKIIRDL